MSMGVPSLEVITFAQTIQECIFYPKSKFSLTLAIHFFKC